MGHNSDSQSVKQMKHVDSAVGVRPLDLWASLALASESWDFESSQLARLGDFCEIGAQCSGKPALSGAATGEVARRVVWEI